MKNEHQEVPGLVVVEGFMGEQEERGLSHHLLDFRTRVFLPRQHSKGATVHIPQPAFVVSQNHNLPSEEQFISVEFERLANQKKKKCAFFPRYGEDGHELAYFRFRKNIPQVASDIFRKIEHWVLNNERLRSLLRRTLMWNMTLNYYCHTDQLETAGFPFHVDIAKNGEITMILGLQSSATLQLKKGEESSPVDVLIRPGDLVVLSGESRWEWKHRILPAQKGNVSVGSVTRTSLVFGVK